MYTHTHTYIHTCIQVSVAGSWDSWKFQTPLYASTIKNDYTWSAVFRVPPGRHEFKFIVNGKWALARNFEIGECMYVCVYVCIMNSNSKSMASGPWPEILK